MMKFNRFRLVGQFNLRVLVIHQPPTSVWLVKRTQLSQCWNRTRKRNVIICIWVWVYFFFLKIDLNGKIHMKIRSTIFRGFVCVSEHISFHLVNKFFPFLIKMTISVTGVSNGWTVYEFFLTSFWPSMGTFKSFFFAIDTLAVLKTITGHRIFFWAMLKFYFVYTQKFSLWNCGVRTRTIQNKACINLNEKKVGLFLLFFFFSNLPNAFNKSVQAL